MSTAKLETEQLKNRFSDIAIFAARELWPTFQYGDPATEPPHCLSEFEPHESPPSTTRCSGRRPNSNASTWVRGDPLLREPAKVRT